MVDAWLTDAGGERASAIPYGSPCTINVELEVLEHVAEPSIALWLTTEDGVRVFSVGAREDGDKLADFAAGERVTYTVSALNPMSAGRYHVGCSVVRGSAGLDIILHRDRVVDMVSYGMDFVGLVEAAAHTGTVTRTTAPAAVAS